MSYQDDLNLDAANAAAQQGASCSRAALDTLMHRMEGLEGEWVGHERNGHARAHLGKSFGRPEGEIQEDIDEVQAQLQACNNLLS
ncbi:hypothetical protein [Tumebacillus flagellatus]|uniref:Uncharacterized protein n=1 Tax=Tumebacillus flagellatus TaxID=1157490 RepID=A0A074LHW2_9BACL|nr:hypothetical protein [Tumebacillus flagellatus]KEO81821.1 hypothetical protein EL26_18440 [Tumebacillus flagellatus]